jgi:hypothetical protein
VLPSPNSRSKTTCGLFSMGSGDFGPCHEIVFRYAQDRPAPQLSEPSSIDSSSEGRGVAWPMCFATTWSRLMPSSASAPTPGFAPVRNTAEERVWFAPAEASCP